MQKIIPFKYKLKCSVLFFTGVQYSIISFNSQAIEEPFSGWYPTYSVEINPDENNRKVIGTHGFVNYPTKVKVNDRTIKLKKFFPR